MTRRRKVMTALSSLVLIVGTTALAASAGGGNAARGLTKQVVGPRLPAACTRDASGRTTKIATAKLIIEYNFTDGDLGVHGAFDDDGWKALCVFDPNGRPVLVVGPRRQLLDLTMAGIFFESREPPTAEFSFADLRATFPEGQYRVRGETFDGTFLVGSATFTHDVPKPPKITLPEIADEPKGATKNPVSRQGLVIDWDRVGTTVVGAPADITGYEVIVTREVEDDPNGFSRPTYDVHVPPNVTSLPVPKRFLERGTVYELEVLALEVSGNQTISVGFFETT